MLINLAELFISEGKEKVYTQDIEMTKLQAPDGAYEIANKEPVVLRLQNVGNRTIVLEGKAKLSLDIPCGRCLELVRSDFDLDINVILDMKQEAQERVADLNEQPYLNGYNLDVDQLVCNELLLDLPMKVLCDENCKGICNRCGANLNHESCNCDRSSKDLQMSTIQDIFNQFKEV